MIANHYVTPSSIKLNSTLIATPEEISKVTEISEVRETNFTKAKDECRSGKA